MHALNAGACAIPTARCLRSCTRWRASWSARCAPRPASHPRTSLACHGSTRHSDRAQPHEDCRVTEIRPLAYFWGEDAWSIDRAARDYRAALEAGAGGAMDVWRAPTDDDDGGSESAPTDSAGRRRARVLDEIAQRL